MTRTALYAGSFDPVTNRLYIHSHTLAYPLRNIPAELGEAGPKNTAGILKPATEPGEEEGAGGRGHQVRPHEAE